MQFINHSLLTCTLKGMEGSWGTKKLGLLGFSCALGSYSHHLTTAYMLQHGEAEIQGLAGPKRPPALDTTALILQEEMRGGV